MRGNKGPSTTSFTEWLFDLHAPANVFWLTQSVPLASMLSGTTRPPTVWCIGQGSGLLLHRRHRLHVYCPWGWFARWPADLPHLCPLCWTSLYCSASAATQRLSSPLIGERCAMLVMRSQNKHRMKDGKTTDMSQRNTVARLFCVCSFWCQCCPIHACLPSSLLLWSYYKMPSTMAP